MKALIVTTISILLSGSGCAGTHTPLAQQIADVESADRSANELGAQTNPKAQLHLKLAEEQLKLAKAAVAQDDDARASRLLMRAKADAELAVALTRGSTAKTGASNAVDQSNAQRSTNAENGAAQ